MNKINNTQIWRERLAITLDYTVSKYEPIEFDNGFVHKLFNGFDVPIDIIEKNTSGRCGEIHGQEYDKYFKELVKKKKN